jgi:hypothetical protein
MRIRLLVIPALVLSCSLPVFADVRTEQKTQVQFGGMLGRMMNLFGGKAAREGVTTTVIVKGDRKVTSTDATRQIIDLAEEKIYDVDLRRKTFKVTTFAELRRQLEEAQKRAAADARQADDRPAKEDRKDDKQVEVEVDFDVKSTGQSKVVNGFNTQQTIMTITVREKGKTLEQSGGLVLTSDMWLTPEQPAMKEVAEFDRRYAEKLYGGLLGVSADQMAAAMAMYPQLREGLGRLNAEASKVQGTAILTTLTFDAVKSAEQQAAEAKQEQPSAGRGIGGMIGGLARRAARKDDDEPKPRATFMTSTVEVLKLSTDVSADDVAVPAGFRETK